MSEPFIKKHAISTELCNVNREKHKLKSHRVSRRSHKSEKKITPTILSYKHTLKELISSISFR